MHALILAGGFATRLWPLTENRAKPLLVLHGKTILAHILAQVPADVTVTVVANFAFADDFIEELKRINRPKTQLWCEPSTSDGEKLGALRAISECVRDLKIEDEIALLAGDNLLPSFDFGDLAVTENEAKIIVRDIGDIVLARSFGVAEVENSVVQSFVEKPQNPTSSLISTGFFALGRNCINHLHDCAAAQPDALGGVIPYLLRHGTAVGAAEYAGEWFDVGSFAAYLDAHRTLTPQKNEVDKNGNQISGSVWISPSAEVKNSILHDCIVYDNTVVENCHVSCSVIDSDAMLSGVDINQKLIRAGLQLSH